MKEYTSVADMHTHSLHSHDSECPIEEMCISQISKGTKIFAVTNHCDIYSFNDYDIYTPLIKCKKEIELLNKKYGDKCLILSGIEISEGFWYPKEYKKARNLVPYDVIIGSVHCVKYKDLTMAYSKINFSNLSQEIIYEYLDCYFNDIIKMLEFMEFDILGHLTCPIRYIKGKYGINIDLERYNAKICKILNMIIEKKIALEVNTSSYNILNDFMPSEEILKIYYSMGGELVTLGSDAHISQNASVNFETAIKTLKKIGFESICYFKERKVNRINI